MQITANCLNTMVMVPQDLQLQGMQMTKSTFITLKKETSCKTAGKAATEILQWPQSHCNYKIFPYTSDRFHLQLTTMTINRCS